MLIFDTLCFRNGGIGLCSSVARIGGICAPLIALLAMFGDAVPYIIFGALGLFGAFLTMFLPEVLDRKLPDTVEEVKKFFFRLTLISFTSGFCSVAFFFNYGV